MLYGSSSTHMQLQYSVAFVMSICDTGTGFKQFCMCAIMALQEKEPGIDMTYLLFQRRQQIRQEDNKSSAGAMSLLARIKFEQSKQESDENGIKARGLQVFMRAWPVCLAVYYSVLAMKNTASGHTAQALPPGYLSFGPIEKVLCFL